MSLPGVAERDSYNDHINATQVVRSSGYVVTDAKTVVRPRARRRAVVVGVAGLVLLAFVPAVAWGHPIPVGRTVGYARAATTIDVTINLTDAPSFSPTSLQVPSNSTVNITLVNEGSYNHSFTLENANQSGVVLNRSWTPAELDRYFARNGSLANRTLLGGASTSLTLTFNASNQTRSFEYVSVVPYQFQAGMLGFLNVSSSGPAQVLSENTTNALSFQPGLLSVNVTSPHAATTLEVTITNLGSFPHTFTVVAQTNVSLSSVGYFATHAPLVNVSVPASAGGSVIASFTVPAAGVYEYACTVPGHFQAGMYGFLYVGVPPPAPAAAPSTAIVEVGVLAGAAALLGIGIVLAAAAGLTGRFPRPPPSEPHP